MTSPPRPTELLAPAGERAAAYAAFAFGADAVYTGLPRFSARAEAVNLAAKYPEKVKELEGIWKPFDDRWAPPPRANAKHLIADAPASRAIVVPRGVLAQTEPVFRRPPGGLLPRK